MVYEDFSQLNEGIVYGYIEDIDLKFISINIKGHVVVYKNKISNIRISKLREKDFVRIYVKDKEAIYIEQLDDFLYRKFMKLISSIKEVLNK
ncbi:MAG TPA: hypothetical protein EYH22_02425 [Candidatus Nanopusillus sp.]|nr:hypothetical protein [Candidatus Nanopusillus sp.]